MPTSALRSTSGVASGPASAPRLHRLQSLPTTTAQVKNAWPRTLSAAAVREELRAFLAQELPEYMLHGAFVAMDPLPLNANGKLDVRSLPSPDQAAPPREFVAPSTADAEKLVCIWQQILKPERVGTTDNFFELGGHSLLATQIISHIRDQFRVQMPLQVFLQNPRISALASEIKNCPTSASEQEEMTRLLQELEGISEEEAKRLLAGKFEKDQN